jgi:hypothetical protein
LAEGWPHYIDFNSLHDHVLQLYRPLLEVLANPQQNIFFKSAKTQWNSASSNIGGIKDQFGIFQGGIAG